MKTMASRSLFGAAILVSPLAVAAPTPADEKPGPKDREAYEAAHKEGLKRFNEACKTTAGKSAPPSTTRVPGIRLEVPLDSLSSDQGSSDPAWPFAGMPRERMGDRFIASFLDFTFGGGDLHPDFGARTGMTVTMTGFQAVDVLQKDGAYLRYRLKGKHPSEGMVSEPVARDRTFRHVVRVEPLEIAGGRPHWVGGSRIRVVDGETGQAMGEVRAVAFALPPEGVKASELHKRSWWHSVTCPKYLDIQNAMTRISLMGIVDPPRHVAAAPVDPATASLEEAVKQGVLREATPTDVDAWRAAVGAPKRKEGVRIGEPFRAYVVLKPFTFPAGLHGAHRAEFYVPKGVQKPTGDPGHSAIFDFNTLLCEGVGCRRG